MRFVAVFLVAPLVLTVSAATTAFADEPVSSERVRPLLTKYCQECHLGDRPKGDFRIDQLSADFDTPAIRGRWLTVLKRVRAGEMPPSGKPRPTAGEARVLADWISTRADAAAARRAAEGRVVLRRLNRAEYENTVRDLLGVEIDLKE